MQNQDLLNFIELLKARGWRQDASFHLHRGAYRIVFDTSRWMELLDKDNARLFDIPVPSSMPTGLSQWTLNLIDHLCETKNGIKLEPDVLLVLFEFLSRHFDLPNENSESSLEAVIEHDGEISALNFLLGTLQKNLPAGFSTDYRHQIEKARERLVARSGTWSSPN